MNFVVYSQASRHMVHETVSTTVGLVLTPTGPKVVIDQEDGEHTSETGEESMDTTTEDISESSETVATSEFFV